MTDKRINIQNEIKDSYDIFFNTFGIKKESFFDFGIKNTIYLAEDKVEEYWNLLKDRVLNNKEVFIRGYGRDAKGTPIYIKFHGEVFGNYNIIKDPSNNSKPQQLIKKITGLNRKENLRNYQVAHVFGMTRNALMFEAPWNIVLVPKIIDPLTGHESNGLWAEEYKKIFYEEINKKYKRFINEYNEIMDKINIEKKIELFIKEYKFAEEDNTDKKRKKVCDDLKKDFSIIM